MNAEDVDEDGGGCGRGAGTRIGSSEVDRRKVERIDNGYEVMD